MARANAVYSKNRTKRVNKVKGKAFDMHAMETYKRNRFMPPLSLKLDMSLSGQLHVPAMLLPEILWYSLNRRLCGFQGRS